MKLSLLALVSFMLMAKLMAQDVLVKEFVFEGQQHEGIELIKNLIETRHRSEQVPDTCTRQEPYTDRVCEDVTHYRQDCSTNSVYECQDVTRYRTQCRSVTRYRQECQSVTRTRQQCRTVGGGQDCRTVTDQQCRPVSREVCRDRNGQRVCRTVTRDDCRPTSRQVCTDRPSRQECRDVPYTDQECRDVPYSDQVCEDEPYTDQDCGYVDRQSCTDIPYTVNECRDITRYNTVTYSCMRTIQVPYEVKTGEVRALLDFDFSEIKLTPKTKFKAELKEDHSLKIVAESEKKKEFFIFAKIEEQATQSASLTQLKSHLAIDIRKSKGIADVFSGKIEDLKLKEQTVSFSLPEIKSPQAFLVEFKITDLHDRRIKTHKLISLADAQLTPSTTASKTSVLIDLEQFDAAVEGYDLKIDLQVGLNSSKTLLNAQEFENLKIQAKAKKDPPELSQAQVELIEAVSTPFEHELKLTEADRKHLSFSVEGLVHPESLIFDITVFDKEKERMRIKTSLTGQQLEAISHRGKQTIDFIFEDHDFSNVRGPFAFNKRTHQIVVKARIDGKFKQIGTLLDVKEFELSDQEDFEI